MPELETEQSPEQLTSVEEPSPELSPSRLTPAMHGMVGVGGAVGRLGDAASMTGVQELPPKSVASLLGRPEFALPANAPQKTRLLTDLQQRYGNAYIQQVMTLVHQERLAARAAPSAEAAVVEAEEEEMASTEEYGPPALPPEPVATGMATVEAPAPQPPPVLPPAPEPAPPAPQASVAPAAPSAGMPSAVEAPALEEEQAAPPGAPAAAMPSAAGAGAAPGAVPGAEEPPAAEEEVPEAVGEEAPAEEAPEEAAGAAVMAEEKAPASPEEDPAFQAVVERSQGVAARQQDHPSAASQAGAAQAAAAGPPNEVTSVAAAGQVGEMDAQEPQPFDRAAFKAAMLQKIADTAPRTLEEADEFKDSGNMDAVKGEMTSKVAEGKEQAQGNIAETVEEPPDTSGIEPKPVTPLAPTETGPPPADIGAAEAAPKPKTAAEVSLQEGSQSLDQQMADAEITEAQLEESNEPSFLSAAAAKQTAQTHAEEAPTVYRQEEQGILSGAQGQAKSGAQAELAAMHGERAGLLEQVTGAQVDTQSVDEQRRAEVANEIQAIYQRAKETVEARLSRLDEEVNQAFDQGAAAAQQAFEDYVEERMDAYKDERYSGPLGWGQWLSDKAFGMPDEVNAFYEEGRELYLRMMDGVLDNIAIIVETGLSEAKAEIARGKQEVQDYVDSLPADLQEVGQEAAEDIQSKFDELEQSVNDKQGELIDSLAQKYHENLAQVDARIEEMKAANRGLVDAAFDAVAGVINTIIELKNMLLNVLSRVADAIGLIIRDPIGFLGNLVSGVMQGLDNFLNNLGAHLQQGLMDWLFGALGGAGIQMPETFDLKGILSLVLQVLGLTYANIRARAVQIVGEPVVNAMEQAADIFKIMLTEGPAGLWNWIKDKVGDLKAMVLDGINDFVQEKIITAGITWIISLLNPASAFIKACKAIYDIVMFFVTRGSQILTLVNAIIDSITAIAQGSLSVAANAVENALARAIPVVIGFLASLLGLGGISEKIRAIIERIRVPINKAIDWVINKAVQLVKAAGKLLGFGKDKKGAEGKEDLEPDNRTDQQKQEDLERAVVEAQALDANQLRPSTINPALEKIREKYRLSELKATFANGIFEIHAAVNPEVTFQLASDDWLAQKIGAAARPKIDALPGSASVADVKRVLDEALKEAFASAHLDIKKANLAYETAETGEGMPIENVFLFHSGEKTEIGAIWHQSELYESTANPVGGPANTFKNRVTKEIFVHDNKKQYVQRYLIRNLSDEDVRSMRRIGSISPTGKRHRTTILEHVMGLKPSPYISATKSPGGQITNDKGETFNSGEQAKIDLCHLNSKNLFDLSTRVGQDEWGLSNPTSPKAEQALKDVIRTQEVLIKQVIPHEALEKI